MHGQLSAKNYVIIRIWQTTRAGRSASAAKYFIQGGLESSDGIGHVSLQIVRAHECHYVSFWPAAGTSPRDLHRKGVFLDAPIFDEQLDMEGRPADQHYFLFSLNIETLWALTTKDALTREYPTWSLAANKKITNPVARKVGGWTQSKPSQSCSGIVYELLTKAGIFNLNLSTQFVRDYVVTTPNNLLDLCADAQEQERRQHKEVITYQQQIPETWAAYLLSISHQRTHDDAYDHIGDLIEARCPESTKTKLLAHQSAINSFKRVRSIPRVGRLFSQDSKPIFDLIPAKILIPSAVLLCILAFYALEKLQPMKKLESAITQGFQFSADSRFMCVSSLLILTMLVMLYKLFPLHAANMVNQINRFRA